MKPYSSWVTFVVTVLAAVALIAACGSVPATRAVAEEVTINDQDASKHVGEHVGVQGVVADVFISGRGDIFLNFGNRYPQQTFTAVIFRSSAGLFDNPAQWKGREVIVRGTIKLYKGRPEIILKDPSQLSSVKQ